MCSQTRIEHQYNCSGYCGDQLVGSYAISSKPRWVGEIREGQWHYLDGGPCSPRHRAASEPTAAHSISLYPGANDTKHPMYHAYAGQLPNMGTLHIKWSHWPRLEIPIVQYIIQKLFPVTYLSKSHPFEIVLTCRSGLFQIALPTLMPLNLTSSFSVKWLCTTNHGSISSTESANDNTIE